MGRGHGRRDFLRLAVARFVPAHLADRSRDEGGGHPLGRCRVVVCAHQDLAARVNPSPFDRTVAFIRRRYRGDPVAAVGIALVVLWAAWVVVYLLEHRHYTFRVVGT